MENELAEKIVNKIEELIMTKISELEAEDHNGPAAVLDTTVTRKELIELMEKI